MVGTVGWVHPCRWPCLAPAEEGSGPAAPGGMFLSCRPSSFGSAADQAFEHLAAWGVRYVEISLPRPQESAQVRAELARHGLRVASVQVGTDIGNAVLASQFDEAARRAREEFGARYIFTSAHAGSHGLEAAYEALSAAGDAAARHGVTIVLETHPDLGTNGAVAAVTMRAVNHPNVRINWDPANVAYYNEGSDGRREFELALPFIAAVHLKDTGGGFHAWDFPALGDGVVDFPYILRRLAETGFTGPCTMEIEGVKDERLTPGQYVARMRRSVDYLHGLGYFRP